MRRKQCKTFQLASLVDFINTYLANYMSSLKMWHKAFNNDTILIRNLKTPSNYSNYLECSFSRNN